jgi:peptidoglycan hydrolase-like protein with peptidoglycan-binding domain
MTKLAYSYPATINAVRKASKFGVALLTGATFLLSSLAAEPAHAKKFGRGLAIGLGAFGLGVMMNEAARAEEYGGHDDDDDYQERSYRKSSKSRSTRSRNSSPKVQFSQEVLETQKSLNQAGYDAGTEDGIRGRQTRAAVKAFQRDQGYEETGRLTPDQRKNLYVVAAEAANTDDGGGAVTAKPANMGPANMGDDGNAEEVVDTAGEGSLMATSLEQESYKPNFAVETAQNETKTVARHENTRQTVPEAEIDPSMLEVEKALFSLQMIRSVPDGKIDDETVAAIKQYQSFRNEAPTGELTPEQKVNLMSLVQAYFSYDKR